MTTPDTQPTMRPAHPVTPTLIDIATDFRTQASVLDAAPDVLLQLAAYAVAQKTGSPPPGGWSPLSNNEEYLALETLLELNVLWHPEAVAVGLERNMVYEEAEPSQPELRLSARRLAGLKAAAIIGWAHLQEAQVSLQFRNRALVQHAAQAGNQTVVGWKDDGGGVEVAILKDGSLFQPLLDNRLTDCMGDALRLAVWVSHHNENFHDITFNWTSRAIRIFAAGHEGAGPSPEYRTRHAIVTAAAGLRARR